VGQIGGPQLGPRLFSADFSTLLQSTLVPLSTCYLKIGSSSANSRKSRLKFVVEIMKKSRKNVYPHILGGGGQGELPQWDVIGTATVNPHARLELSGPSPAFVIIFFRKFAKNRGSVWGALAKNLCIRI